MKFKALTLAILAVAAGSANAAITPGSVANQSGELFINVFSPAAQQTFVFDTGLDANTYIGYTQAQRDALSWDLGASAGWSNVFKTDPGLQWNMMAGNQAPSSASPLYGAITSSTVAAGSITGLSITAVANISGQASLKASSVNNVIDPANLTNYVANNAGAFAIGTLGGSADFLSNPFSWTSSRDFAGSAALNMIFLGRTSSAPNAQVVQRAMGSFTLNAATGLVSGPAASAVPVPAALWLLGSGLTGLVTIARRGRKSA